MITYKITEKAGRMVGPYKNTSSGTEISMPEEVAIPLLREGVIVKPRADVQTLKARGKGRS